MKRVICSVYDSASQVFSTPMFFPAVGAALRAFRDEVNRPDQGSAIYSHPSDFELFELGEFDDNLGAFLLHDRPKSLARAVDIRILTEDDTVGPGLGRVS